MFNIGTSELLVILLIALLVLGPKEIPMVARTLGRVMREFQRITDELKHTIDMEIDSNEEVTTKPLKNRKQTNKEEVNEWNKPSSPDAEMKKEVV